ncbi:DNA repair protein RecN [Klebsiella michiganensis]|uniref:DNA repair protein RecN n=1 Tax=Klebsiella michiganensis TaxID=1134687 RepID=A0A7H4PMZ9_9ENTR|nr:DNA repair protein RecN [Klebsiella michiganensis]
MVFHTGRQLCWHQLTISHFAIVRELEIDFHSGMTAITGETGAGKSIAIDALGLCLGGRRKPIWCAEAPAGLICAPVSP